MSAETPTNSSFCAKAAGSTAGPLSEQPSISRTRNGPASCRLSSAPSDKRADPALPLVWSSGRLAPARQTRGCTLLPALARGSTIRSAGQKSLTKFARGRCPLPLKDHRYGSFLLPTCDAVSHRRRSSNRISDPRADKYILTRRSQRILIRGDDLSARETINKRAMSGYSARRRIAMEARTAFPRGCHCLAGSAFARIVAT